MGRIHVLSENVANKIAAGEVVERPASVVKELLENALDAGRTRIRVNIEAGGKKLIQVTDNGCGMVRDDAMLAFERHATSQDAQCRRPARASPPWAFAARRCPPSPRSAGCAWRRVRRGEPAGTVVEIAGGKMLTVEEAGLPLGTSITVRDLFFNIPARRKFLKAESTELSHIASLVTHYALAHPEMHWELHSATNAMLVAPPVGRPLAAHLPGLRQRDAGPADSAGALLPLERIGLPQPPPWQRDEDEEPPEVVKGEIKLHGFVSQPEIQKLNRNSIFIFVNGRLIRDRLIQHALTEAYRNIIPPTVYPGGAAVPGDAVHAKST